MSGSKRILVLDDDAAFLEMIRLSLEKAGYEVDTALHAAEAWLLLRRSRPDLILCDIMLPGMDGLEFRRQTQKDPEIGNLPFIFLTAKSQPEDRVQGLRLGADDYVVKPFERAELLARIEAVLGRVERARAEALHQAQRQLESLKEAIIGNISFELRTPVTAILTTLELMLSQAFEDYPDQERLFLQRALVNAQLLRRLIDDLIILASLQTGGLDLFRRPLQLWDLFRVVDSDTRASQSELGVSLEVSCPPDPSSASGQALTLNADREKLRLAVMHLVDNALKFSRRGSVVRLAARAAPEGGVEIQVQDTGVGIAPEHLPHIFERFYQVDTTTTRPYRGMGNGLDIVQAVARAHGGEVTVQSQPARGSTFTLHLPDAPPDWPVPQPAATR